MTSSDHLPFACHGSVGDEALAVQDSFATADLYQVVSNIYGMRFFPIDGMSMVVLAGAMFLPFLAVVFMAMPFDNLVSWCGRLLF